MFEFWRGLGYKTYVKNLMGHEFSGVCVCVYACMYVSVNTMYAYMRVGYVSMHSQGNVATVHAMKA